MKNKSNKIKLVLSVAFCVVLMGCTFIDKTVELSKEFNLKTAELNTEFNLKKNESAKVSGTDMKIKMLGAGHSISEGGGSSYCNIEVSYKGKTDEREVDIGDLTEFEGLLVEINKVDENGGAKGSDPFANTNCTFLVKRK